MGQLLEKILSPVKNLVAAAIITAAVAGMPSEAQAHKLYDHTREYTYFTQSKNITDTNTQLPAKKGLLQEEHKANIISRGNHQEKERVPSDYEKIKLKIGFYTYAVKGVDQSSLHIDYHCSPRGKISGKIPIVQQVFREDLTNTHIYLALPDEVEILRESQKIHTINNRYGSWELFDGMKLEETKIGKALKKYNETIGKENKGGKTGKVIDVIKKGMKLVLEKDEEKRIEDIRKTYGKDIQIYKMPFFQKEDIFKYTQRGRLHSLSLDIPKDSKKKNAYLIIPKMSFIQEISGTTRIASIEDLIFEIPLDPEKKRDEGSSGDKNGNAISPESPHKLGEVIKPRKN